MQLPLPLLSPSAPWTTKCCAPCGSEPAQRIATSRRIFHRCSRMPWWAGGAVAGMEMGWLWGVRTGWQLVGGSWKNSGIADFPIALQTLQHPCQSTSHASRCSYEGGKLVCAVLTKCISRCGERKVAAAVSPAAPGRQGT